MIAPGQRYPATQPATPIETYAHGPPATWTARRPAIFFAALSAAPTPTPVGIIQRAAPPRHVFRSRASTRPPFFKTFQTLLRFQEKGFHQGSAMMGQVFVLVLFVLVVAIRRLSGAHPAESASSAGTEPARFADSGGRGRADRVRRRIRGPLRAAVTSRSSRSAVPAIQDSGPTVSATRPVSATPPRSWAAPLPSLLAVSSGPLSMHRHVLRGCPCAGGVRGGSADHPDDRHRHDRDDRHDHRR